MGDTFGDTYLQRRRLNAKRSRSHLDLAQSHVSVVRLFKDNRYVNMLNIPPIIAEFLLTPSGITLSSLNGNSAPGDTQRQEIQITSAIQTHIHTLGHAHTCTCTHHCHSTLMNPHQAKLSSLPLIGFYPSRWRNLSGRRVERESEREKRERKKEKEVTGIGERQERVG